MTEYAGQADGWTRLPCALYVIMFMLCILVGYAMYAVLCCAVLCCAVLCCAALHCTVLHSAALHISKSRQWCCIIGRVSDSFTVLTLCISRYFSSYPWFCLLEDYLFMELLSSMGCCCIIGLDCVRLS